MTSQEKRAETSSGSASQAAFINKLYSMLEDGTVQHLICWDPSGTYFIVNNITEFSKSVLPQYFKHNNFASFVRQLNMYGFHKINDMYHGNSSEVWEFKHPDFRRGEVDLLQNIKRKSSKMNQQQRAQAAAAQNLSKDERIDQLTSKVMELEEKLAKVHESYNLLWSETVACRLLQSKHHQVITNITSFLASIYREDSDNTSRKRKFDVDILQAEVAKISPQDTKSNSAGGVDKRRSQSDDHTTLPNGNTNGVDHSLHSEAESADFDDYGEEDFVADDLVDVTPPAAKRLKAH